MPSIILPSESPAGVSLLRFVAKQAESTQQGDYQAENIYEKDINDKYGIRGKKRTVRLKLAPGSQLSFPWENGTVTVSRQVEEQVVGCGDLGPKKFDVTKISSENLSRTVLKKLLVLSYEKHEERSTKKTVSLRIYNGTYWDARGHLPKRHPATVFLPEAELNALFTQLERFENEKETYHRYQIPYKQVILLDGPPGTGKTSLAYTLASKFQRDLYLLPLTNDSDDYALLNALSSIAPGSVLVLEDIDCLFKTEEGALKPRITLSGITNALDGLSRIDNLWIIITTNHASVLPAVLLRKGRVDYRMTFDSIKAAEVERMVGMFFEERTEDPDISHLKRLLGERAQRSRLVASACLAFLFNHRDDSASTVISKLDELVELPASSPSKGAMYM